MPIKIHEKMYITVAERVSMAHKDCNKISITTELVVSEPQVVVKATVVTPKGTFTGYSAANPDKLIEKQSPYEVAETSAVGRALGFAGYGVVEGIATADEMVKANNNKTYDEAISEVKEARPDLCTLHGVQMKERVGKEGIKYHDHRRKNEEGLWEVCQGKGWHTSAYQG